MKSFAKNLLDFDLLREGDEVLITDPKKDRRTHSNNRSPGPGWFKVASTEVEHDCLYVWTESHGKYGVYLDRILDWRPAPERMKDEAKTLDNG